MSRQQTLEQRRAAKAWEQTERIDKKSSKKEYGSLVRGLPANIQVDGLGQTLAFLKAKDKDKGEHRSAYDNLQEWLCEKENFNFTGDLLEWLMRQSSDTYRHVTAETQAYLLWLKRFAEAKGWKSEENGRD
jgi:CRISPR-associated protein Cmr5